MASVPEQIRKAVADTIRRLYGPMSETQWSAISSALDGEATATRKDPLTKEDFLWAAEQLEPGGPHAYAKIRAVDACESRGDGFDDAPARILELDGPGGFINGLELPKILFEAHKFGKFTGFRFNRSHPNVSSSAWNRSLYVGGIGEWERLYRAMELDKEAALMSASWGRYQIMGFNHKLAGFSTVEEFAEAMKTSERKQLEAFVSFIKSAGLKDEFRKIGGVAKACEPFARAYNGPGQVVKYSNAIAAEYRRYV